MEFLGDLTDQTMEGELPVEELGELLVAPKITDSHGAGPARRENPTRTTDENDRRERPTITTDKNNQHEQPTRTYISI